MTCTVHEFVKGLEKLFIPYLLSNKDSKIKRISIADKLNLLIISKEISCNIY